MNGNTFSMITSVICYGENALVFRPLLYNYTQCKMMRLTEIDIKFIDNIMYYYSIYQYYSKHDGKAKVFNLPPQVCINRIKNTVSRLRAVKAGLKNSLSFCFCIVLFYKMEWNKTRCNPRERKKGRHNVW